MGEITAFLLGLAFKSIAAATLGVVFGKFTDRFLDNVKDFPRVFHYFMGHDGKSPHCQECAKTL